jgi:hypothetical protein
MMGFPFAGDRVGSFVVESVEVGCDPHGSGRYTYPVRLVLRGLGGKQGVREVLKELIRSRTTTFSAYGNAYQLWFSKPEIESLGDKRYAVTVEGAGARVTLADELRRFAAFLEGEVTPGATPAGVDWNELVGAYLDGYRAEVKRKVGRYRSRLRRIDRAAA